jgi:choline dehydrogenase-like flavoprotein
MSGWAPTAAAREYNYNVCVVGLGGHGSAIAAHLAQRGAKVLGLEKFGAVHDQVIGFFRMPVLMWFAGVA